MTLYRGIGTTDTTGAVGATQSEEVQTATASQTVFTLTTMTFSRGEGNLVIYINGVRQETSAYTEGVDGVTVTFSAGLEVGDTVAFVSGEILSSMTVDIGSTFVSVAELEILEGATVTTAELNNLDGVTSNIQTQLGEKLTSSSNVTLNTKVIEIGDWNMVSNSLVSVAHGLTLSTIRTVKAIIRNDVNAGYYDITNDDGSGTGSHGISCGTTNITLYRRASGLFDSTSFDSTSFNRGWITVQYIA